MKLRKLYKFIVSNKRQNKPRETRANRTQNRTAAVAAAAANLGVFLVGRALPFLGRRRRRRSSSPHIFAVFGPRRITPVLVVGRFLNRG